MTDKTVLITGCSTGIGLHLAQSLTEHGYHVFASARKPSDVVILENLGLRTLQLDVANSESIQAAVKTLLNETNGKLYALVNNAGFGQAGAVEDLSREALRNQFETNLFGLVELTNSLLPVMYQQGYGRVIQISSVLGFIAMPFRGAYIASKFALEGISDTLRLELENTNIHVSIVEPGPITSCFRENSLKLFKKYINSETSRFHQQYQSTITRLESKGPAVPFTLEPEAVTKKVLHALNSGKPKQRYYVTVPTYLFAYLKRILPTHALDKLLSKSSKVETK